MPLRETSRCRYSLIRYDKKGRLREGEFNYRGVYNLHDYNLQRLSIAAVRSGFRKIAAVRIKLQENNNCEINFKKIAAARLLEEGTNIYICTYQI